MRSYHIRLENKCKSSMLLLFDKKAKDVGAASLEK